MLGEGRLDTDPEYDRHVQLLLEAARINPTWGASIWEVTNDDEMDAKVIEAAAIVEEQADGVF